MTSIPKIIRSLSFLRTIIFRIGKTMVYAIAVFLFLGTDSGSVFAAATYTSPGFSSITASLNAGQTTLTVVINDGSTTGGAAQQRDDCSGCSPTQDEGCAPFVIDNAYAMPGSAAITTTGGPSGTLTISQVSAGVNGTGCFVPSDTQGTSGTFSGSGTVNVSSLGNGTYTASVTICNILSGTKCTTRTANFTITNRAACGDGTVNAGEQCDDGDTQNGDGCNSSCQWETKTYSCNSKPTNTLWNTVSSYLQTCTASNGTGCTTWNYPDDSNTDYNPNGSTTSCRYKCANGYSWNGSACVAPCDFTTTGSVSPTGSICYGTGVSGSGNTTPADTSANCGDPSTRSWTWTDSLSSQSFSEQSFTNQKFLGLGLGSRNLYLDVTWGSETRRYTSPSINIIECYSCTGTTPSNAAICSGDNSLLTADTPKTVVSSCTSGTKCEYTCNTYYHKDGNSCTANACATAPTNATVCSGDDTNVPIDNQANLVVDSCTANSTKCEWSCNTYYHKDGNSCSPNQCASAPANATVCSGDDTGISTDGQSNTIVTSCVANSTKCEWECNDGYHKEGNICVQNVCTGTIPGSPYSASCSGDETNISGNSDVPRTLVDACTSTKCEYTCNTGFIRSGTDCIDATPPTVSTSYLNGCSTSSSITVTTTESDPESGVSTCNLERREATYANGVVGSFGVWTSVQNSCSNYTFTATNGKAYQFRYRAQNNTGTWSNWNENNNIVKVDTTVPVVSLSYPNGFTPSTSITVATTESDAQSGLNACTLDRREAGVTNGVVGTFGAWTQVQGTCSDYTFTGSSGVAYQFRYRAQNNCSTWATWETDNSDNSTNGKCGTNATNYSQASTTWPSTTAFCATGTAPSPNPSFPAAGGATDWVCQGQNGGSSAACTATRDDGTDAVNGRCGTNATNYSQASTTWPSTTAFCAAGTAPSPNPSFPTEGGATNWVCQGQNGGENSSCTATRDGDIIIIDPTPPAAPIISYINGYSPAIVQTITFSSSDSESGIEGYVLFEKSVPLTNGTCGDFTSVNWMELYSGPLTSYDHTMNNAKCYRYYVVVYNNAGLSNQSSTTPTATTKVDTIAPICPGPSSGNWTPYPVPWSNIAQSFALSGVTDTGGSGINVSGGTCTANFHDTSCSITNPFISDNAGNVSVCSSPKAKIDKTKPVIGVTGAPSGWQNSDATAGITCTDNLSGCDTTSYRYRVYTSNPGICPDSGYTGGGSVAIAAHSWVCGRAKDAAGNWANSSPVEFTVDETPPTCGTWSPDPAPWRKDAQLFTLENSTDDGGSGLTPGTYSCSVETHGLTCTVPITDIAGNSMTCPPSPKANIDTELPAISASPVPPYTAQNLIVVDLTPSDTGGSELELARYAINEIADADTGVSFTTENSAIIDALNHNAGENSISWWARDHAGNEASGVFTPYNLNIVRGGNVHNSAFSADTGWVLFGDPHFNLRSDLEMYLPFDEQEDTTASDVSGNGHNGTVSGATWFPGIVANGLLFDGSGSDFVTVPANPAFDFTGDYTLEAWIQPQSFGTFRGIVGKNTPTGWGLNLYTNKVNLGAHGCTNFSGTTTLEADQWYHVVGVFQASGNEEIYVNGQLDATGSLSGGNCGNDTSDVVIGRFQNATTSDFDGIIDEVKIYDRALIAEEVMNSYSALYSGVSISLISDASENFPLSGEAYSENLGIIDFVGGNVKISGNWAVMYGDATFAADGKKLTLASGDNFDCGQLVNTTASPMTLKSFTPTVGNHGVCIDLFTGYMYGHAWNSEYGWLTFADDPVLATTIGSSPLVDDTQINSNTTYQVTTNWAKDIQPAIDIEASSDVFMATDSISDIPLASVADGEEGIIKCNILGDGIQIKKVADGVGYSDFKRALVGNVLDEAVMATYPFQEGVGNLTADSSGNGNTGTLNGGTTWTTTGKFGNALSFNPSTSDSVTIPEMSSSTMSVSAWIRPGTTNGNNAIVMLPNSSGQDEVFFGFAPSSSNIRLVLNNVIHDVSGVGVDNNVWTHLAFTYDGAQAKIYKDGVEVDSYNQNSTLQFNNCDGYIGMDVDGPGCSGTPGNYFNGLIDEVRIYNRALTPEEVAADMAQETIVTGDILEEINFTEGIDYRFTCTNGAKTATLRLEDGIAAESGLYWLSGHVLGATLKNTPTYNKINGVSPNDPIVYQVVAAEPCWDNTCISNASAVNVSESLVNPDDHIYPLADLDDSYDITVSLYDRFGNSVNFSEPLWFQPNSRIIEKAENTENWGANGTISLSTDSQEGTYSVQIIDDKAGPQAILFQNENIYDVSEFVQANNELGAAVLEFWVYLQNPSVATPTTFEFSQKSNTQGAIWDNIVLYVQGGTWQTGWNKVSLPFAGHYQASEPVDWSHIDNLKLKLSVDNTGLTYKFDAFKIYNPDIESIADIDFTLQFDDRISPVQILGDPDIGSTIPGDATRYRDWANTTDIPTSGVLGPVVDYVREIGVNANNSSHQMQFSIQAMAPTNYQAGGLTQDNTFQVENVTFSRTANNILQDGFSGLNVTDVTQQLTDSGTNKPQLSGSTLIGEDGSFTFAPLIEARSVFPGGTVIENRKTYFDVYLQNNNEDVPLSNPHWLQSLRTRAEDGALHTPNKLMFESFNPVDLEGTFAPPDPINFFEMANELPDTTDFSSIRNATDTVHQIQTLPFNTGKYSMTFTPKKPGSWDDTDRIAYLSYISYELEGNPVKYMIADRDPNFCASSPSSPGCLPMNPPDCSWPGECCAFYQNDPILYAEYAAACVEDQPLSDYKTSVIGATHGEIVETEVNNEEAVSFETGFIAFEAIQNAVRNNVAEITRGVTPLDISSYFEDKDSDWNETTSPSYHAVTNINSNLVFTSIDELFTPDTSDSTRNARGVGRLLEDGRVLWITADNDNSGEGFTIVIDSPSDQESVLGTNTLPKTIILEGGNLYVKENIRGEGHLGVILLRNRRDIGTAGFERYGNLFIHPSVTNVKSALFAEGSILTLDDSGGTIDEVPYGPLGIYDGFTFSEKPDEWNTTLNNQLYLFGAFSSRNTLGGRAMISGSSSDEIIGIPNDKNLLFPPGTSFDTYKNSSSTEEYKEKVSERFDLKMQRTFIRTLVLENDRDGNGIIDDLEDAFASDPSPCGVTIICIADSNGPKVWAPVDEDMEEAERFDGNEWTDLLTYDSDGNLTSSNSLEDIKYKSSIIVEYDPSLPDNLPIGFSLPPDVNITPVVK